jgi:hypothetical protein
MPLFTHGRVKSDHELGSAIYVWLKRSPLDTNLVTEEMPIR